MFDMWDVIVVLLLIAISLSCVSIWIAWRRVAARLEETKKDERLQV